MENSLSLPHMVVVSVGDMENRRFPTSSDYVVNLNLGLLAAVRLGQISKQEKRLGFVWKVVEVGN